MKRILFSLFLLLGAAAATAQNCQTWIWPSGWANGVTTLVANDSAGTAVTGYLWSTGDTTNTIEVADAEPDTYCVTITYVDGCTASDCYSLPDSCWASGWWYWLNDTEAYLTVWGGPTYMNTTYQWSNGATTSGITVTVGGEYCVTITKDNGCTSTVCLDIPATGCYVDIEPWYWPDSTVQLHAAGSSNNAVYIWNTGQSGEVITLTSPGYYCVTMTDANGCTASDCFIYGDTISCSAYIYASLPSDNIVELAAYMSSSGDTYLWSTGATTQAILVGTPGNYCVTTTNSIGCSAESCYEIAAYNNVYVYVQIPDSLDDYLAEVFLIQYDSSQGGILTAIDTVTTSTNGFVLIENVPLGQYLVKAALLPGSAHYGEYLPTYHEQSLFWNEATPISVGMATPWNNGVGVLIHLIEGQNPGGPGFIGGLVSAGANFTANDEANRGPGDPLAGVQVILRREDDTAVAATRTAADGSYGFDDLAWGTYRVSIDLPGILPVHQLVTIGPDQPAASTVDFAVDGLGASAAPTVGLTAVLPVHPNPVHNLLTVSLPGQEGELMMTNAQGQTMLRRTERGSQVRLDVAGLPVGWYFLRWQSGQQTFVAKIAKH